MPRLTARQRLALDAVIVVLGLVLLVALVILAIRLSEPRVMGGPLYIVRRSPAQRVVALLVLIVKVLVQGALVGGFCLAVYWRWFRKEGGADPFLSSRRVRRFVPPVARRTIPNEQQQ